MNNIGELIRKAEARYRVCYRRAAGKLARKVTANQVGLLTAIHKAKGANQIELVKATGIDRSTISVMLKALEANGYVRRERDAHDPRSWRVYTKAKGGSIVSKAGQIVARAEEMFLKDVGANKTDILALKLLAGKG